MKTFSNETNFTLKPDVEGYIIMIPTVYVIIATILWILNYVILNYNIESNLSSARLKFPT